MENINFTEKLHTSTKRDYIERVARGDKAECSEIAKRFGSDYWDGDRKHGYGGYKYDGRWKTVAEKILSHYDIKENDSVLDVGCGKGFLLYEMKQLCPDLNICGVDISEYAINNSKEEVRQFLKFGHAQMLDFTDNSFDLVFSLGTLHNLYVFELKSAVKEIQRVSKGKSYILVESYRNDREKDNLLNWQLTCEAFFTPKEWEWLFNEWGYTGDYGFMFFE